MILRCTNKLLAAIGPGRLDGQAPDPDPEDWYGNLVQVDGRACLLLTHVATLFTVLEARVGAPALRNPHRLAAGVIERELLAEGLPTTTFGDLRGEPLRLAKTADRRVLGCMNDMAFLCDHAAATDGGLARTDLAALNRLLRRNINSTRGYQRPIDLTVERLHALDLPGWTRPTPG